MPTALTHVWFHVYASLKVMKIVMISRLNGAVCLYTVKTPFIYELNSMLHILRYDRCNHSVPLTFLEIVTGFAMGGSATRTSPCLNNSVTSTSLI